MTFRELGYIITKNLSSFREWVLDMDVVYVLLTAFFTLFAATVFFDLYENFENYINKFLGNVPEKKDEFNYD